MKNKRLIGILVLIGLLLMIPLIAMQFTNEINWTLSDFIIMGVLLLGTGLLLEVALRKVKTLKYRIALGVAILTVFLFVWAELAVGLVGSPFAGS